MSEKKILKLIRDRGINVLYITEDEFENLKDLIYDAGIDRSNIQESVAMLLVIGKEYTIVINNDSYKKQDEDTKVMLLAHELGHSEGFVDEEKADFNSLKFLNKKQKQEVINNWQDNHKRKFTIFLETVNKYGLIRDF